MEKEKLIAQAKKLHLSIKEEVLIKLVEDSNKIKEEIDLLKSIDVLNIEPMVRISKPITFLREDIVDNTFEKKNFLNNSPKQENGYVTINKVVKND